MRYYARAGWRTNEHACFRVRADFLRGCGRRAVPSPDRPEIRTLYPCPFVQDASCPAGKVLKVTGAIRGLHRKKTCVVLASEQASLSAATP